MFSKSILVFTLTVFAFAISTNQEVASNTTNCEYSTDSILSINHYASYGFNSRLQGSRRYNNYYKSGWATDNVLNDGSSATEDSGTDVHGYKSENNGNNAVGYGGIGHSGKIKYIDNN
eukprot:90092_1